MKIIVNLLCAGLLGLSASAFCENTSEGAMQLVIAARLDFVVLDAVKYSILKKLSNTQTRDETAQCITENGVGKFSNVLASHIASDMSESEINEQVNFYNTPLGKKTVEATLISLHHDHQFDRDQKVPEFSSDEMQQVQSFLASSSSTKLGKILSSPELRNEVGTIGAKIIDQCKPK